MNIEEIKMVAEPACERFRVKRLDAFGSTARGTAKETSDVDLLVEFKEPEEGLTQMALT
ncbi:MAG: nucleotidyltransferase domain-containing protein [Verrucomicrobia bacterium]|nr:nucleotidyltransferase domain-containing protein [Verrucomicrobiota bacterium]